LKLRHILSDVINILILEAIFDLLARDILNFGIRPLSLRDAADCDVPVSDHADQLVMFADW